MSEAIQKVMLDYVIPNLTQDEIEELIAELAKLSSSADPPKPREWRRWDMVVLKDDSIYLRTLLSGLCWEKLSTTLTPSQPDDYINARMSTYRGNLADLLAQGDVLVALTEEEANQTGYEIADSDNMDQVSARRKCRAALAARKGTK